MVDQGKILIADDEETFLMSTADLLRKEGYECDCASNAVAAAQLLRTGDHDLLIADIKMPGNSELEFIQEMPDLCEGMPVILVTGFPTLDTAIRSIQLQVVGYFVKPPDFDQLLTRVRDSIKVFRVYRSVRHVQQHVKDWYTDLDTIRGSLQQKPQLGGSASAEAFLELTFKNIIEVLSDLKHLSKSFALQNVPQEVCHLFSCPRLQDMTEAIGETIKVLRKTKSSFKSKEIERMRKTLELLLQDIDKNQVDAKQH